MNKSLITVSVRQGAVMADFSGPLAEPYTKLFPDGVPLPLLADKVSSEDIRHWWSKVQSKWPGFELVIDCGNPRPIKTFGN